ncbi:UNVERIFIED_CONTAM: hypothetical protein GTU68_040781, partial [Idotea baltica]|nr:hypothetical protein [Idotea baltica]
MAKAKTLYICQECGASHLKWQGQCKGCESWGSLVEELTDQTRKGGLPKGLVTKSAPQTIPQIDAKSETRWVTKDDEMNRVLGGGIVDGSVTLLGGAPGIGKSTLLLQLALQLGPEKILYVSGEESLQQVKLRASRIPFENNQLFIAAETQIERIFEFYEELQPRLIVIDSIQTMYTESLESAAGSVSQVREGAAKLIRMAKDLRIPIFLVGHITKEGMLAGPKVLEHMVDTVLTFEGERHNSYRIVRTNKNRFGSTMEIG